MTILLYEVFKILSIHFEIRVRILNMTILLQKVRDREWLIKAMESPHGQKQATPKSWNSLGESLYNYCKIILFGFDKYICQL